MAAYLIGSIEVTDPQAYEEYRKLVPDTIAAYGGKYLVRGSTAEVIEGDWDPKRLVILEFESMERAKEWYDSPEYSPLKQIRFKAASSNIVFAEGA